MMPAPAPPLATHCCAPAGLLVSSHSKPNRFSKKLLLHFVGVLVQVTSRPLVIVSPPLPVPKLFLQPRPCSSRPAASGSAPTCDAGAGAVRLAEGVAAGDQRDGLLVVHRHAAEGLADVARRGERIGIAVRAFGVDVDQAHLHGGERVLEVARVSASAVVVGDEHAAGLLDAGRALRVADVAAEPRRLAAPVDVLVRLPDVRRGRRRSRRS